MIQQSMANKFRLTLADSSATTAQDTAALVLLILLNPAVDPVINGSLLSTVSVTNTTSTAV